MAINETTEPIIKKPKKFLYEIFVYRPLKSKIAKTNVEPIETSIINSLIIFETYYFLDLYGYKRIM